MRKQIHAIIYMLLLISSNILYQVYIFTTSSDKINYRNNIYRIMEIDSIIDIFRRRIKRFKNNNIFVNDPIEFINNNINTLEKDHIYIYNFSQKGGTNKIYSVLNGSIDELSSADLESLPLLWATHRPERSFEQLKESIIKKLVYISEKNYNKSISQDDIKKYDKLLNSIGEDKDSINKVGGALQRCKNETIINQHGGILIWWLDKYVVTPNAPTWVTSVFHIIIEVIDIAIFVVAVIPVLKHAVGPFFIDFLNVFYNFLRFDIIGMMAAIVAIIPVFGDIGAIPIKVYSKIAKTSKYALKAQRAVSGAIKFSKYAKNIKIIDTGQAGQQVVQQIIGKHIPIQKVFEEKIVGDAKPIIE